MGGGEESERPTQGETKRETIRLVYTHVQEENKLAKRIASEAAMPQRCYVSTLLGSAEETIDAEKGDGYIVVTTTLRRWGVDDKMKRIGVRVTLVAIQGVVRHGRKMICLHSWAHADWRRLTVSSDVHGIIA